MEDKSNLLNRIKRHQREKVLRFSIRKYSFGAASVAVAALMFLGARVASADSVSENTAPSTAGVVYPNDKGDSPVVIENTTENKSEVDNHSLENKETAIVENSSNTVDKSQLRTVVEKLNSLLSAKLNLDESVLSSVKERVQRAQALLDKADAVQKDINELKELLSTDLATLSNAVKESSEVRESNTGTEAEKPVSESSSEVRASEESQTVSAKKDALKVSVDQLQAAILEVPKHDTTKEVLEKANEVMVLAQGVLENTTVSLTDVEQMNKLVKRMFNSVKNATTRLNSGARDSRNGKSTGQGTGFRATTTDDGRVEGALINVKEYISEPKGGTTDIGNRDRTITKTFMTAKYSEENGRKYITYDVYFQNDGHTLGGSTRNAFWFYPPRDILHIDGGYPSGTLFDTYYERYRNNGSGGTLSHNPNNFTKVGDTYYVPSRVQDSSSEKLWKDGFSFYQLDGGPSSDSKRQEMLKHLQYNSDLNGIIKPNGRYPGLSYSHVLTVASNADYAYKYHVKMRLRDNVTADQAKSAGVMAVTTKAGLATNATAGYVYAALGSRLVTKPDAQVYPIKGSSHTKTVGDTLLNPENPVAAGYITLKNGGEFPSGMEWGWKNNNRPSTNTAGIFTYTATARYQDGSTSEDANSGSDGRVYFTVKPKKPAITTDVANKKGLPNQQITVNVGNGVEGSTVKLYDGDREIGTGTAHGGTATITVTEALPGNPITAKTIVTNTNGTVTSDKSAPVTPTEAPDTQRPTLTIKPSTQTVVEGQQISFTVTATDDKNVNLDAKDFLTKYLNRIFAGEVSTTREINEVNKKVDRITITTKAEDLGKTNTITFNATDNAGNKADPATFTFTVTPRDNQKPIVEVGGIRLTENEPQSAQFYVYRGATFNPTVKAWDDSGNIKSMSVENLPNGSTPQTYTAQTGKTEATPYATPLSSGTVADTQTLGDHVAKFRISDGVNSAIYQMKYKVVDVVVENTPKTVELNSKSGDPNEYLNTAGQQDQSGKPVVESQADVHFPGGMKFRWDNANGSDTNITLSKVGTQTHKAIAVFPKNPSNRGSVQVFAPEKAERNVVFNVVDNEKPKASLNGKELSETANEPIFTVYRGATFNPELKVSDNSGVISKVEVKGGLPKGVTPSTELTTFTAQTGKTEATPYAARLSSGTVNTETLGVHESTIHVEGSSPSDSRDFKFKYRVVDIETKNVDENSIARVPVASTLNKANSSKNIDAHNYLKVVDSEDKADRGNNYLPSGMTWTWKDRDGVNKDRGTTLDNSGKYTRTAVAIFPGTNGTNANNMTDATSTTRDVFAPAEIKRQVILAVTPTAPIVEGKENGSVTITPPTRPDSTNKQDIDKITLTYVPTGKTTPETVTVTKSGNTWTATVNGKPTDKVSVSSEGVVTISDAEIADKTEVTAKVSKNIDGVLTLESPVAIGTANGPLAAEVTNPAPVPEKAQITPVTVVTPNKPGSSITVDGKINGLTVDEEGKLKGTPEVNDWKPKEEERTVEIPVKVTKGGETVTVKVPVPILRDTDGDGIPDKVDTDDDNDGIPDKDEEKNGTDPKTPTTQTPTIGITRKENGDAIVTPTKPGGGTYPRGTTVTIPGNDNTPIEVTIGNDGSGTVPNDKLPKTDKPGTGTVTESNKKPSQPVNVTTPARKTPTLDVEQNPKTGEVTVTPQKPGGGTYPPGTTVEIPGKDGNPITVEIGQDGKGKVPNDNLPKTDVPGTGKITEPNKPAVEVPNVTTPAKITPETPETEKPVAIEITRKPNGNAIVTPKKPDGKNYPSGSKVVIPGENNTPITVTIGDNGSGEVPNDNLPKTDVPGTGTVTESNKKPSQPVNVTTPARKTPTLDVEQNPKTGEVTVTPQRPGGGTYPPGTTVEIPGKDKDHPITVTTDENGKAKVPNADLPDGKVPGTGKITEPGKPAVEVPVTTPGKVTPATPTDTNPVAPVTPDTDAPAPTPATPTPNAVTPNADQVDTKTTMDNGAKTNDSQNVLPNTGTESNATLASLGLLGLLSGFGLVARKKKED